MDKPILGLIGFIIILTICLLPAGIAARRKHHQSTAIFILNLIMGVTALGWIFALGFTPLGGVIALGWASTGWLAALVWAFTAVRPELNKEQTMACPHCAERVMRAARICKHCDKEVHTPAKPVRESVKYPAPEPVDETMKDLDLAKRYGIKKETGYYVFQGRRCPSLDVALKFARAAENSK